MELMIQVGYKTDKGRERKNNEDACVVIQGESVYVAADGVGGNAGGEVASQMAVSQIEEYVKSNKLHEKATPSEIKKYFQQCLESVNDSIAKHSKEHPEYAGMATTVVICCIRNEIALFISVGDSRGYVLRKGALTQVTEDHTYVNEMKKAGLLSDEDDEFRAKRHVITRALGADEDVEPDFKQVALSPEDVILLCTDGLYEDLSEDEIISIIKKSENMVEAAEELVNSANVAGGSDNITAVCLRI